MSTPALDEKAVVKAYFNETGFERWRRIYGEGEVNKVQADIRAGHQETVNRVLAWLKAEPLQGRRICDAGCGVGSLSIPLAEAGALVYASDLSEKMVAEAQARARQALGQGENPVFAVNDLEHLEGRYDTVVCLDVLIHYPDVQAIAMLKHLSALAERSLIISFAPWTPYYSLLKWIGNLFPGPSKATRAYLHRPFDMTSTLEDLGWVVQAKTQVSTRFYFSYLVHVVRPAGA